ncbi:Hypothetical protein, putative [Bodo saltans]|uniref:Uncharacterized protein n=1 Tax=Bodo saltans TaxID=75058 RepID=A0A0S4IW74_BODSA|nr:Hypothetical protein, putative [Bodo saltans]|eukprot:CUF73436.1 Hypothetical protein, putative [Bodo saltans]
MNTKTLVAAVEAIQKAIDDLSNLNANGVFNDKEQKKQQTMQKKIEELKQTLAEKLSGNPMGNTSSGVSPGRRKSTSVVVTVADDEHRQVLDDFVESLVQDTDNKPGNLPLMRAFLNFVTLDYPSLCESRGFLSTCAVDGSMGYLEALLGEPQGLIMRFDTEELLASAMYNQQYRIPLVSLLLRHEFRLNLNTPETIAAIGGSWNEFIADIASKKKAISREDRSGQKQLVEKMITHPLVPFDIVREGGDGLTLFSRACLEGEVPLIEFCIQRKLAPPPNHPNGDGSSALMQAVISNSPAAVKAVLGMPDVDVNMEGPHGTALQMASLLKRDPAIITMLKERGMGGGGGSGGGTTTNKSPTDSFDITSRGMQLAPDSTSRRASTTTSPAAPVAQRSGKQLPSLAGKLPTSHPSPPPEPLVVPSSKKPPAKLSKMKGAPAKPITPPPPAPKLKGGEAQLHPLQHPSAAGKSPSSPAMDPPAVKNPRMAPASTSPQTNGALAPLLLHKSPQSSPPRALEPPPHPLQQESAHSHSDEFSHHSAPGPSRVSPTTRRPTVTVVDDDAIFQQLKNGSPQLKRMESEASLFSQESQYSLMSLGSTTNSATGGSRHTGGNGGGGPLAAADILDLVRQVCDEHNSNLRRASMGVFTEAEFVTQDSSAVQQLETKVQIAVELRKHFSKTRRLRLNIDSTEEGLNIDSTEEEEWIAFFVSCVQASDIDGANEEVVLAMLETLDIDFSYITREHNLLEAVAADGSVSFLAALLALPSIKVDLAEVLPCCIFHAQCRIPLTITLLKGLSKSQLLLIKSESWAEYQECFSDVCSLRKEIPGEERHRRLELIELMITNHVLRLDPQHEANDGQTAFSRAAHEGDAELVKLFVKHRFVHSPNHVLPDGATALVHAVYGNSLDILRAMLMPRRSRRGCGVGEAVCQASICAQPQSCVTRWCHRVSARCVRQQS